MGLEGGGAGIGGGRSGSIAQTLMWDLFLRAQKDESSPDGTPPTHGQLHKTPRGRGRDSGSLGSGGDAMPPDIGGLRCETTDHTNEVTSLNKNGWAGAEPSPPANEDSIFLIEN